MNMRKGLLLILPLLAPLAAGCGDTGTVDMAPPDMAKKPAGDMAMPVTGDMAMPVTGDMAMPVTGDMAMPAGGDMAGPPAPPALGTQIDRMGRPGVNTAVTDPFDAVAATQDMNKDKYNADMDPTKWATNWTAAFIKSLAIYDGLDATCGNQAGYNFGAANPPMTKEAAYGTLAGALADDELWVDTTQTACALYLGVEFNALATGGACTVDNDCPLKPLGSKCTAMKCTPLAECGGRTLTENVIDSTYNVFVDGAPAGGPVSNGVTVDGDHAAPLAAFPFLNAAN
jgi:hypothetical protein